MKRVFALIMALCLFAALLPMTVMAEAPTEVKVKFYNGVAKDFTLTINAGDTAYVVPDDNKEIIKWTEEEAPADNFLKMEYVVEETATLKATFSNFVVDQTEAGGYTCHGIWFQGGEYAVAIELIGENSMTHGKSACIKSENSGGMTITGAGSMSMNIGTAEAVGSASGALWTNGGNLLIKDTTMNFTVFASASAKHHSILSAQGNVTIENCKINTSTLGGQLVYTGLATDRNVRYTLDPNPERFIKIKDSEIIGKAGKTFFESVNPVTIENCTMKLTLSGSSGPAFSPAPVFEGDFTAIAGLAKNAEKLDKLKEYNEKKLASYTYLYVVPGIVDLLPTEPTTEATEPEVTIPEVTIPEVTVPQVTEPKVTTPKVTEPKETTPATTEATTPATDDVDDTTSGNPLMVVLIVMIALLVVAAATIGVLFYIRKKKA